jgi:hypothetical protein
MLGLGASSTSIASANIYKELSELENYADLDIHFDFSLLTGANGDEVTAVTNLGAGGATYNIDSNVTTPLLDTTTLSRNSVLFNTSNDVLNMAAEYTTTGKAYTLFVVFQKDDTSKDVVISADGNDNYLKIQHNNIELKQGTDSAFSITTNNTSNVSVNYSFVNEVPTCIVVSRQAGGNINVYADNGFKIAGKANAAAQAGANFAVQEIGGTAESANDLLGNIGEIGLYDANLTEAKCLVLARELSTKWGINRRL